MADDDRCPSVANVVDRADGGLVRIRLPGGRLTAAQLRAVAAAAAAHGSGVIELTNRANLQLRGVRPGRERALAADLQAAGVSHGAAGDLRRNVMAGPLDGLGDADLVDEVVAALDAEADLDGLSPKWGVALDGGGPHGLAGRRDDVVVTTIAPDRHEVRSLLGTTTVAAGGVAAAVATAALASLGAPRHQVTAPGAASPVPLGAGPGWSAGATWLGRLDPAAAAAVADAALHHGSGTIRLTPWRSLLFPDAGTAALDAAGLISDPADPATRVVACAGSTGCTSGLADTLADAAAFVGAGPGTVHVSGCAKRCAHPGPAAVTFVAVAPGRYDRLVAG